MSAPTTAINRFDLSVGYGEFSLLANMRKFVGLRVLPPLGVMKEAASFKKVEIESYLTKVEDTRRAPRSAYPRDFFNWTTDSYDCSEHGVEEVIDDADVERYGDILRAEQLAAMRAIHRVLQRLEYDIAAAVFNTTTWAGAALTTAVSTPWTTVASATPITDIDAAHDKVNAGCGEDANTLVLTKKAFRAILRADQVTNLLKYDASTVLLQLNSGQNSNLVREVMSGLHELLQVEQIVVARGFQNTADRGQSASLSRIWDDTMAMLCVVNDDGFGGDLEDPRPNIGRTILIFSTMNGEELPGADMAGEETLILEEYREEQVRGSVLRPRNKRQVKILHPQAGHLLTAVTA